MKSPIKKLKIRLMISFIKKSACPLAGFFSFENELFYQNFDHFN